MNKEELNSAANNCIKALFHNLLYKVPPKMISDKSIKYEIGSTEIELIWFTKREKDEEHKIPVIDIDPFKDKHSRSMWGFGCFEWQVCHAPELEGYSFYINTPAGQYKVPELDRRTLVDVQERIEELHKQFGLEYIKNLVIKSNYDEA